MLTDMPVTFGRSQRSLSFAGFRLTEAQYDRALRVAPHEHRFPSWTAVLEGDFGEQFRGKTLTAEPGMLLAKPADARHSDSYGPAGARVILIEMTDAAGAGPEVTGAFRDVQRLPAAVAGPAVTRLRAQLRTAALSGCLGIHATLLELARLLWRGGIRTPRRGDWLRTVEARLRAEFASAPSLGALARDAGLHPVYLCSAFRDQYGCPPGEFVRRMQLEHARRMLSDSKETISAIAHSVGFADHSHLVRRFRAAFGITPSAYRRLAANP
jgi:AraC family transcriptional regulator